MIYAAAIVVIIITAAIVAHMKGTAQRNIEFRKAFRQRCLEDERDHQDQR